MLSSQNIDPSNSGGPRFFLFRWPVALWHWLVPPTQAHQDRQSGTARLVAAWILVSACLLAIGLAFGYARPIYGQYKEWRSAQLVSRARELRDKGDIVGAVVTAGKAVLLAPEFAPAVRVNAELLTMISQDQALFFWDRLAKLGAAWRMTWAACARSNAFTVTRKRRKCWKACSGSIPRTLA